MMETYWHFVKDDRRLNYTGEPVEVGRTYRVDGPPVLCERGLHASARALDALKYAPGPVICRVVLTGEIVHGGDKSAATERTVLAMADATAVLHEFACRCAEQALALVESPDPRSVAAVAAKRAWRRGEIDDDELRAARAAAWDAAWDAAGAAAGDAARDAAWAAAGAAAGDAAGAAAWAAAWDEMNDTLEKMLGDLFASEQ